MNVAVLLAGGVGKRFSASHPKQLLKINDLTLIERCILAFKQCRGIDHIYLVYHSSIKHKAHEICTKFSNITLVEGGKTRQKSVHNALIYIANNSNVLIHDVARAYVDSGLITKVLQQLHEGNDAVDIALPIHDTIKHIDNNEIIDRDTLYSTQTPQGFKLQKLLQAHEHFNGERDDFTDDISLYMAFHGKNSSIKTVAGSPENIKITTKNDIKNNMLIKTGHGVDFHAYDCQSHASSDEQHNIMICGVAVPSKYAVLAHSDGDVGIHAVVDAIFGALAIGDIGDHFPPSDDKWHGADSAIFLTYALKKCQEMLVRINNIDVTIICERPKISAFKQAMKNKIAELLDIDKNHVNIKATTTEKLGFIGREEGIGATASCTISAPDA